MQLDRFIGDSDGRQRRRDLTDIETGDCVSMAFRILAPCGCLFARAARDQSLGWVIRHAMR